jgi:hypothetical protein
MEEKQYTFAVYAKVMYVGVITANSIEEAKEKCYNHDYDDIIDQCESEVDWDTLNIEED